MPFTVVNQSSQFPDASPWAYLENVFTDDGLYAMSYLDYRGWTTCQLVMWNQWFPELEFATIHGFEINVKGHTDAPVEANVHLAGQWWESQNQETKWFDIAVPRTDARYVFGSPTNAWPGFEPSDVSVIIEAWTSDFFGDPFPQPPFFGYMVFLDVVDVTYYYTIPDPAPSPVVFANAASSFVVESGTVTSVVVNIVNNGDQPLTVMSLQTDVTTPATTFMADVPFSIEAGQTVPVTLQINARNTTAGTYSGLMKCTVYGNYLESSAILTITVTPPSGPALSPVVFTSQENAFTIPTAMGASLSVSIVNNGDQAHSVTSLWTGLTTPATVFTTAIPFTLQQGQSKDLTLSVNPANTVPGTYSGLLRLRVAGNYEEAAANLTLTATADFDNDSLPDWWEISHFDNITSQTGAGDPDQDGYTNAREYALCLNPNQSDFGGPGAIFEAIPLTNWAGSSTVASCVKEITSLPAYRGWDRFYLSSAATKGQGWTSQGLSFEVNGEPYSIPGGDSVDITESVTNNTIVLKLKYTGGNIQLNRDVFFHQWRGQVEITPKGEGDDLMPGNVAPDGGYVGSRTWKTCLTTLPPNSGDFINRMLLVESNMTASPSEVSFSRGMTEYELAVDGGYPAPCTLYGKTTNAAILASCSGKVFGVAEIQLSDPWPWTPDGVNVRVRLWPTNMNVGEVGLWSTWSAEDQNGGGLVGTCANDQMMRLRS